MLGHVGSTGVSTGPHCRFELWTGGSRMDVEPIFSGLSFLPQRGNKIDFAYDVRFAGQRFLLSGKAVFPRR